MIDTTSLKKAWALLDRRERQNAWIVLAIVSISALTTALMVSSIFPFLTVLSDPSTIHSVSQLDWVYQTFGFGSDYAFLVALGLGTLAIIVFSNVMQLAQTYAITRYSQMRIYSLSRKLLGLYLNQPYEFFLNRHSGDMSTRVLSEVDETVRRFFRPIADFIAATLTIIALIGLLIVVNPAVAIGAFVVFGGAYGMIFLFVRKRLVGLGQQRIKANTQRFLAAKEVLSGIKEVKLHGHEDVYLKRYGSAAFRTMRTTVVSDLIGQLPKYFMQSLAFGGIIILCLVLLSPEDFGTSGSSLREFLPTIGIIAFAGQRMMPELSRLYKSLTQMKFGMASVNALFADIEAAKSAPALRGPAAEPLGLRFELRLDGVSYRYPNAVRDSLSETSLTIKAGERIGIVGGTGAGKTTLADLILGLLSPSQGHIMADGIVIEEDTRPKWQRTVGYVPQDIFLIDASIAENIAFGLSPKQIDRERMERAARLAQLDAFVQRELPAGYETTVGERGVRLSGGQRQRIGIARALYHDVDLIIFDEATSALDNLTEREVMSSIDAVPGSKTILMIAHRLSTVKNCDRIIFLDQGRIVGIGSWSELLEQNASFRELAAAA